MTATFCYFGLSSSMQLWKLAPILTRYSWWVILRRIIKSSSILVGAVDVFFERKAACTCSHGDRCSFRQYSFSTLFNKSTRRSLFITLLPSV